MKLTIRSIAATVTGAKDLYLWDDEVAGFGLRVKPSGVRSFFLQYRNVNGMSRRLTLGKLGVLTPEEARKRAKEKLAEVAKGGDPAGERNDARQAMTVAELCDLYLEQAETLPGPRGHIKKQSTLKIDRGQIERHVKPLLGKRPVTSLTPLDIEKLQTAIAAGKTAAKRPEKGRSGVVTGGQTAAARTVAVFGAVLEFARRRKVIEVNPARGVKRYHDKKRKRFLSDDELKSFGEAMRQAEHEGENKTGLAAIRALLLTGCRRNEILSLPWDWLDAKARCIRFGDTKTGAQIRPIGADAAKWFEQQPRRFVKEKNGKESPSPWVFPADIGEGHFIGLPRVLARVCVKAGLKDVTVHVLRHSFASHAAQLGFTELTIAGLLGHTARGVTNRYSHLPDNALISAASQVAAHIAAALDGEKGAATGNKVVPFGNTRIGKVG